MELSKGSSFEEQNAIAKAKREAEALKKAKEEATAKDVVANADFGTDASIQKTIHEKGKQPEFPSK